MRYVVALLVALAASLALVCPSRACSPPPPVDPYGWPLPGAKDVSTATSVFVLDSNRALASPVEVRVNGALVDLDPPVLSGSGYAGYKALTFWKLPFVDMLPASSEIVLSRPNGGAELTRFTTAAGYDKPEGTAPLLRSIELARVRYPVSEISSGNCVFAEYHGFIALDWDQAAVPATPDDAVVYTIQLRPKTGGSTQSFTFFGSDALYRGTRPQGPEYFPPGWSPELDPSREYCATITAYGYGDRALALLASEARCASVTELCKQGATDCGAAGAGDAGSSCVLPGKAAGCSTTAGDASLLGATLALAALAARRWRRG